LEISTELQAEIFVRRGVCYLKLGERDKAIQDYRNAQGIDPTNKIVKQLGAGLGY